MYFGSLKSKWRRSSKIFLHFLCLLCLCKLVKTFLSLPTFFFFYPSFHHCLWLWCSHFALSFLFLSFPSPPSVSPPTLMPSFVQIQVFDVSHILHHFKLSFCLCLSHTVPDTHVHSHPLSTDSTARKTSLHLCLSVPFSYIPRLSLKSSEP